MLTLRITGGYEADANASKQGGVMPDDQEPKPEETEEAKASDEDAPENKPLGFFQYPAPPGQTEYGTYQNPHK